MSMPWRVWPLLLALWAAACSNGLGMTSGEGGSKDGGSDASDASGKSDTNESGLGGKSGGGADEPTWINGSYLTCTWNDVAPDNIVQAGCGVASTVEAPTPPTLKASCAARDHRSGAAMGMVAQRGPLHIWLTIDAALVGSADLTCTISGTNTSPDRVLTQPLSAILPRANEAAITSCLAEQGPGAVRGCLIARGITLPAEQAIETEGEDISTASDSLSTVTPTGPSIVRYSFTVQILNGSRSGQTYRGSFEYDTRQLSGSAQETLTTQNLRFDYLPEAQQGLSGTLTFANGEFVTLAVQGGPSDRRFGINDGFGRSDFLGPEAAFIRNGDPFFGYLDADGYIDGIGTVSFTPP